jgi:hypothetical protein
MNIYIAISKEIPTRYLVIVDGKQSSIHDTAAEAITERERLKGEAKTYPAKR